MPRCAKKLLFSQHYLICAIVQPLSAQYKKEDENVLNRGLAILVDNIQRNHDDEGKGH
jgi:uncharacterized protein YfbU (UPF0304 family)